MRRDKIEGFEILHANGRKVYNPIQEYDDYIGDFSHSDSDVIIYARRMMLDLLKKIEKLQALVYNAITLGQEDELYGEKLCDELGCSKKELLEIADDDEMFLENIKEEKDA